MINGHKGSANTYTLKEEQWKLIEQLVIVLKALQIATSALCEAEFASVSLVYLVIHGFLNKHLVSKSDNLPVVKAFKEKYRKRFQQDLRQIVQRLLTDQFW